MKWAFSIEHKIKASLAILLLIGVVFFSNYRLKRLAGKVAKSVQTIYEDRLLVQDMIFSYSNILNALKYSDTPLSSKDFNDFKEETEELKARFLKTVLTEEEELIFNSFSDNLNSSFQTQSYINESSLAEMKHQLQRLEAIQLEEAKNQMDIIEKVKRNQQQVFYLETIIMIILLVIVQILITSNESIKKITNQDNFNLN